jgi:hypothetical protein
MSASMTISDFTSSGFGSGFGSIGESISPHADRHNKIPNKTSPKILSVFIIDI